jgi:hypothetical protein
MAKIRNFAIKKKSKKQKSQTTWSRAAFVFDWQNLAK